MHQLKNSKLKIEADFEASLAAKDLELQSMKLRLSTLESNYKDEIVQLS